MPDADRGARAADGGLAADEHATLLRSAERLLDGVDRALASLDDGTYGTCKVCGTPLGDSDLEDDPVRVRCPEHRAPRGE